MVFVDPKKGNFQHYARATLVKPNLEAAAAASGIEIHDQRSLGRAGERLLELWEAEAAVISRGGEGMSLFRRGGGMSDLPTAAREAFHVTGAGHTGLAHAGRALAD